LSASVISTSGAATRDRHRWARPDPGASRTTKGASVIAVMIAAFAALPMGFVAGFYTFKRSEQWCPVCG